jgi:hypothetical protein
MHPSEALSPRDVYGSRVTAYVLDLALVAVSIGPLPGTSGWIFAGVFSLIYLGVLRGIFGWSLAGGLVGAKLVKAGTLDAPGPIAGVIRWVLAPLGIPVITTIASGFNDRRRGVGDLVAGTEVVGLAPAAKTRALCVIGYVALLSIFVAWSTFSTFVILAAIIVPMAIGGLVVVFGARRMQGGALWLAGLAFALVAAALMSFQGLCKHGGGTCADLSVAHKAIPALVLLAIAIVVLFTMRGVVQYWLVAGLTAVSEVWMFLRLREGEDMAFGAWLMLILLALGVVSEVARYRRRRAELEDEAAVGAAAAAA